MTPGMIRLPFWDMTARNSQVLYVCLNQEASSAPEHLKGRKNIVNAYNKRETILAENENREPELMPHISAHILRHTGCTRLGENNVNPKVMQYVMGCWMSGGHPLSTDRSGAKTILMRRSL